MQPVNVSRVEKYTDGRVRPVIVEFQIPLQAKSVISKAINQIVPIETNIYQ